jgi:hypothetical protein
MEKADEVMTAKTALLPGSVRVLTQLKARGVEPASLRQNTTAVSMGFWPKFVFRTWLTSLSAATTSKQQSPTPRRF